MAIKTGDIYKGFTFGGISSKDYGVYISGSGVFNAPERDITMLSIPGRNGEFVQDNGRFLNVEVNYPAGLFGQSEADFAEAISDLRNALASLQGYQRLEDDYHPDEFRMAVYRGGLEVDPANLKAGEFMITFECKPQRFLKSGETAVTVANGGTLTNPTLFQSSPLIEVWGVGHILFNGGGYDYIAIEDTTLGRVTLADATENFYQQFSLAAVNPTDTIRLVGAHVRTLYDNTIGASVGTVVTGTSASGLANVAIDVQEAGILVLFSVNTQAFTANTSGTVSDTFTATVDGTSLTAAFQLQYAMRQSSQFPAPMGTLSMTCALQSYSGTRLSIERSYGPVWGDSTVHSAGAPAYIDTELGIAYKYVDGEVISLNSVVAFGNDELIKLEPGENRINYTDSITQVDIVPRWWKV